MYRELCVDHYKEYRKQWREKHKIRLQEWHKNNDKRRAEWQGWKQHERLADVKWLVFTFYGGNPPTCACCGESAIEFLCMDHINGGGEKHRKEVGAGVKLYRWLIKNNYPEGFRVLCHNCNSALGFYGYCPHHKVRI